MANEQAEQYFKTVVAHAPRMVHDRIHYLFPGQFTFYVKGAESYQGSQIAMVRFLVQKSETYPGGFQAFKTAF